MKFDRYRDDDLAFKPLKPGKAKFQVVSANEAVSNKGNAYVSVILKLKDTEGNVQNKTVFLALPSLFKHFMRSIGMFDHYMKGEVEPRELIKKTGFCILINGEYKDKKTGDMKPTIEVSDFLYEDDGKDVVETVKAESSSEEDTYAYDDDIPFN